MFDGCQKSVPSEGSVILCAKVTGWQNYFRHQAETRDLPLVKSIQTNTWTHPAYYSKHFGALPRRQNSKLTTYTRVLYPVLQEPQSDPGRRSLKVSRSHNLRHTHALQDSSERRIHPSIPNVKTGEALHIFSIILHGVQRTSLLIQPHYPNYFFKAHFNISVP